VRGYIVVIIVVVVVVVIIVVVVVVLSDAPLNCAEGGGNDIFHFFIRKNVSKNRW